MKGYLLSASASLLAAHNVSGLYSRSKEDPSVVYGSWLGEAAAAAPPALLASTGGAHIALAYGEEGCAREPTPGLSVVAS